MMKIDEQEWEQVIERIWEQCCTDEKLKTVRAGHLINIMKAVREEIELLLLLKTIEKDGHRSNTMKIDERGWAKIVEQVREQVCMPPGLHRVWASDLIEILTITRKQIEINSGVNEINEVHEIKVLTAAAARKLAEAANLSQFWLPQAIHVINNRIRDEAGQGLYSITVNLYTHLGFPSGLGKIVQERILVIARELEQAGYHLTCTENMNLIITWERTLNTG